LIKEPQPHIAMDLRRDWRFMKKRVWRWQLSAVPTGAGARWNCRIRGMRRTIFRKVYPTIADRALTGKASACRPERPNDEGRWLLESDGFYGTGDLWLNGGEWLAWMGNILASAPM